VLSRADLRKADFTGAKLNEAVLEGASLQGARFGCAREGGELQLGCAHLEGANLSRAQLQGANLTKAYLQGADLQWAKLQSADLRFARLQAASLVDAEIWRTWGGTYFNTEFTNFSGCDSEKKPWIKTGQNFTEWRDSILKGMPSGSDRDHAEERISDQDPKEFEPDYMFSTDFCRSVKKANNENSAISLANLAC
jgi:uncharacterized protein YjbI with pentapeptide repeats